MEQKIVITIEGEQARITRREALDRVVRDSAARKRGKFRKLWEERKARDRHLAAEREAYEARQRELARWRAEAPQEWQRWMAQQSDSALASAIATLDQVVPGLMDVRRCLLDAGAVETHEGGWTMADWLRALRP